MDLLTWVRSLWFLCMHFKTQYFQTFKYLNLFPWSHKVENEKVWPLKKNKFCIHRRQKKYICIPPTFSFNFSWSSHRNASKPWISPMVATLALFQKQAWWNQFGIYGQQKTISIAYVEATQEIVIKYGFFLLYSSNIYHLLK